MFKVKALRVKKMCIAYILPILYYSDNNLFLEMLREDDNQDNTNVVTNTTTGMTATAVLDNNHENNSQGSDHVNENINDFLNLSQGKQSINKYSLWHYCFCINIRHSFSLKLLTTPLARGLYTYRALED